MDIFNYALVIFLSVFTTVIFIGLILYSDRKSKEPVYMIITALSSCIFTISLSLLLGQIILPHLDVISAGLFDYKTSNIVKIIVLALVEEYSKLLVLYLFISKSRHFDDIYDGFVYSSLIALSFAVFENLYYVSFETTIESMKSLAILRSFTTVPLHLICGISMGYFMGREKFSWGTGKRMFYLMMSLIFPTFLHFTYNFTLTNIVNKFADTNILMLMVMLFFVPFYLIAIIFINKTRNMNKKFMNNEHYKNLMTKEEYDRIKGEQY